MVTVGATNAVFGSLDPRNRSEGKLEASEGLLLTDQAGACVVSSGEHPRVGAGAVTPSAFGGGVFGAVRLAARFFWIKPVGVVVHT